MNPKAGFSIHQNVSLTSNPEARKSSLDYEQSNYRATAEALDETWGDWPDPLKGWKLVAAWGGMALVGGTITFGCSWLLYQGVLAIDWIVRSAP
jgi:hypothetical protein